MATFYKKYGRYLLFIAVTVLVVWAFYTWRQLLLPFIVGLALAYLLLPLVRWVESYLPGRGHKWEGLKRVAAILIVVLVILAVIGLIIYFAANAIASGSADLMKNASEFIQTATVRIQQWLDNTSAGLPEAWRAAINNATANLGDALSQAVQHALSGSGGIITSSLSVIFSFATLPLFLFYILKDADRMKTTIFSELPPEAARHGRNIFGIVERTLGRYFRAELVLGLVVGTMTLIGLLFINPAVAFPLAIVNGFLEIVPTVGPILGGIMMAVVFLAVEPDKVLLVVFLAVAVQLLENNILVPRIQAANLRLHPSAVLFLLVMGSYFWGLWGLVFAVPVTAMLVDIFRYVRGIHPSPAAPKPPAR